MTMNTARYGLPLLALGQAQKEMFHNEALNMVDGLLHPVVEAVGANEPPPSPEPGQSWILGATPAGAWVGRARAIACWTEGGWRFRDPVAGLRAVVRATRQPVEWDGVSWREGEVVCTRVIVGGLPVLGARRAAVPAPAGGSVVDVEARGALAAILEALRGHGLIA